MIRKKSETTTQVREHVQGGKGKGDFTALVTPDELRGHGRLFNRIVLEPGASIGEHDHTKDFEVYYILSGKGLVNDNGKEIVVEEGDVIYTADGAKHSIENIGDGVLDFLAVVLFDEK